MALGLYDRAQQTGTANTTVSFTVTGNVTGFQSLSVIGNGNTTYYTATDVSGSWEVGIGTYSTTGPTLTRDTILSSSNSGSAVTFSGTVNIWIDYPAEKAVNLNADGVMEVGEPIGYADTGLIATFASTEAGYNQVVVQNLSNDTNASANINISNNVSTDSTGFAELGINSSTFVGTGSFSIPSGAYLASAGTDLTIGTYNANDIHFVTNSNTVDAMIIHDGGGVALGGLGDPGIGNIACNNINLTFQQVLTTGGTTFLTNASPYYTQFTGTNTQILQLPDATTCLVGTTLIFDNDSTQNVDIKDGAGSTFELLVPGGFHTFVLQSNSTVAGTWLRYSQVPSAVEWGTTSLSLGPTVITGGTWNGGTIGTGYGGTGLTTYGAADYALYSTSASTLTAGTLPVAAGGTGAVTLTGYIKGTGTSAFTASSTIPSTDISGLGTIATQNASSVAITGGTIDGTTVGASTPSTGAFTSLLANGVATFSAGTESAPAITTIGDTNTGIFFPAADTIAFTDGGVESMRIDVDRNIRVNASTNSTTKIYTNTSDGSDNQGIGIYGGGSFNANRGAWIEARGNETSSNGGFLTLSAGNKVGSPITLRAGDQNRMTVNYTGSIAFNGATNYGTSGQVLQSNGDAPPTWINQSSIVAGSANTASTATVADSLNSASGYQVQSFGVGTAPSGTSGEIRATNNITAFYSSDARLKENIQDVDNALDKVCAIGSKTFDWTDDYIASKGGEDGYFVQKSDFGVVAQDVQDVFPQAVRTREDGTLAVDYEKLATLAFGAIKELVKRVEALEAK